MTESILRILDGGIFTERGLAAEEPEEPQRIRIQVEFDDDDLEDDEEEEFPEGEPPDPGPEG